MSEIEVVKLSKAYGDNPPVLKSISFSLGEGETLGIVGASGGGKTTLLRCILGLHSFDTGHIRIGPFTLQAGKQKIPRQFYQHVQMIFQNPFESMNPTFTVHSILREGLVIQRFSSDEVSRRITEVLELVQLPADVQSVRPGELSGGQRQRVAIARALSMRPKLLLADEPVSALDVSVQAKVLQTLREAADAFGCSLLFISHDIAVVRYLCPRISVLAQGLFVDTCTRSELLDAQRHQVTKQLVEASTLYKN